MKCNQCQTEFEGKFCPECGTKQSDSYFTQQNVSSQYNQVETEKHDIKRKKFFFKWWYIIIAIIVVGIVVISVNNSGEKIAWNDIILGKILPKPPTNKGEIHYNSADELWIDINGISEKQYATYVETCKEKGFTIDAKSAYSSYNAYNDDGYKLELWHNGSDDDMSIKLEKPMEMTTIKWPSSIAGKLLPIPKSTKGLFTYEYDDKFFVYIGDTNKSDYNEYVDSCSEKGFNVDYDRGDDYYYADNSEGWHISLRYEGNNIMSINIDNPNDDITDESSDIANESSNNTEQSNNNTVESKPDVTEDITQNNNGDINPEFKSAMDSYEKFIDEYVAFMKKYNENPSDLDLLSDYADYMSKYADFVENFEKWKDEELNATETAYYIDVQARVSKKLLEVANQLQ